MEPKMIEETAATEESHDRLMLEFGLDKSNIEVAHSFTKYMIKYLLESYSLTTRCS